ncbi:MAG: hypothetical protein ACM3PU_12565, partial [Gemmatimonadota bacterium]
RVRQTPGVENTLPGERLSMDLSAEAFRAKLDEVLANAEATGLATVDVNAGYLHRLLGGYPGTDHRMPVCCDVMRQALLPGDQVMVEPPKNRGASFTVRFRLPRTAAR